MAIYHLFEQKQQEQQLFFSKEETSTTLLSTLMARFFFFLLLIADFAWAVFSLLSLSLKVFCSIVTLFKSPFLLNSMARSWLSLKRSIVCGISLFVALFAPSLGIMFSCIYFLMYDREGVDEVVPSPLRDQFKEFFPEKN